MSSQKRDQHLETHCKILKNAPNFVKKIRKIKKMIEIFQKISETLAYTVI